MRLLLTRGARAPLAGADARSLASHPPCTVRVLCACQLIGVSIATSLITEAANYAFVYSTDAYKQGKAQVDRLTKTLDEARKEGASAAGGNKKVERKVKSLEGDLQKANANLQQGKLFVGLGTSVLFMGLLYFMGTIFKGVVVAKIPFEPPQFFHKMTHRTLEGDDFTDASYSLIYMLAGMSIKANVSKLLGFGGRGPRSALPFGMPAAQ